METDLEHPDFPPRMSGLPLVFGGLAAGSLIWLLATGGAPRFETWGPVAALAVGLEVGAVSLGEFGFFSSAFILWLPLALASPRLAALAVGAALGLRLLLRGHPQPAGRLLELVADLWPVAAGLGVAHFFALKGNPLAAAWAGAAAYGVAWTAGAGLLRTSLPHRLLLGWGAVRDGLGLPVLGICGGALLGAATRIPAYYLVPVAIGLAGAGRATAEAANARLSKGAQRSQEIDLQQHHRSLARTEQTQKKTGKELNLRLETYGLIDRLLATLPSEPGLKAVAHGLIEQIRIKIPCQSAALFLAEEGRLIPAAFVSVHSQRLNMVALTGQVEPIVEQAWRTGRPQQQGPGQQERIFPDESCAVAVPMRDRGAFYVGDPRQGSYSADQVEFLQALADHACLALDAALYHQSQKEHLARESTTRAQLQGLLGRLSLVMEGVGELVALQDPGAILECAGGLVARLLRCDLIWLRLAGTDHGPEPTEGMLALAEAVGSSGRPLMLEDSNNPRFAIPGMESVLAVPVFTQRQGLGVMLAAAGGRSAFAREDLDILSVLAYQLGGSFTGALLFAELQKAHQELKESQAALVQSSKLAAVGQLAGGVAHELNTPLGAISIAIDGALMNLQKKPERVEPRLTRAVTSVQKMKEIVAKLLFYSRDARSYRRDTNLNQVVADTLDMIGNQLRLDNIEVETRLAELPFFEANQNELQQVLTNLLINARDAVLAPGAGARRIEVGTAAVEGNLLLRVRDWGQGMTAEVRERIFEPFFTTKEVGHGTGLGLSVTIQIVRQHGGTVDVQSSPGQGTQFTVTLPQAGPKEPEA